MDIQQVINNKDEVISEVHGQCIPNLYAMKKKWIKEAFVCAKGCYIGSTNCWFGGNHWALAQQCPVGKTQSVDNFIQCKHMHGSLQSPCFKWRNSKYFKELITSVPFLCGGRGSMQGLCNLSVVLLITDTIAEECHCWLMIKSLIDEPNHSSCLSAHWCNMLRGYWTTAILYRYLKHATFKIIWLGRMGSFS